MMSNNNNIGNKVTFVFFPILLSVLILVMISQVYADPLDNWHDRNPFDESYYYNSSSWGTLHDVAYGNGIFVAVGSAALTALAYISSDGGVQWHKVNIKETDSVLFSIAYGNGVFVAVGDGPILTSTNGENWTIVNPGRPYFIYAITFAEGSFIAIGENSGGLKILKSQDGKNWSINSINDFVGSLPEGLTYCNGTYVAVGFEGINISEGIYISHDGITWVNTYSTHPYGTYLNDVACGNGKFIAVGSEGTLLESTDGTVWEFKNSKTMLSLEGVAYGNGAFVVVGGKFVAYSYDGENWNIKQVAEDSSMSHLHAVVFGNNTFVAVGGLFSSIYQSDTVPPIRSSCDAILSAEYSMHIPIVVFNNQFYWADFQYVSGTMDFILTGAGIISDIFPYSNCTPATLSSDLNLHIPAVIFNNDSYWVDMVYKEGMIFTVTGYGHN